MTLLLDNQMDSLRTTESGKYLIGLYTYNRLRKIHRAEAKDGYWYFACGATDMVRHGTQVTLLGVNALNASISKLCGNCWRGKDSKVWVSADDTIIRYGQW